MRFATIISVCAAAATAVYAVPVTKSEILEKSAAGLRLIRLAEGADPVWMTEDEKLELMRNQTGFFDITDVSKLDRVKSLKKAPAVEYPAPSHQSEIKPLLDTLSIPNMEANLANLTAFNNRYYRSSTGADASSWILDTVSSIAAESTASAALFSHSFTQSSIIAKIPGTSDGPITILGAHMDSINLRSPTSGRAPGADDDGSGSVNLIEIFRALLAAGFTPTTPVEFHWYAGEEGGLLGSQDIAASYADAGKEVKAMMELDMTAYFQPGTEEVVAFMTDNVDAGLTTFAESLVDEYLAFGYVENECGYGCSDHASWFEEGYPPSSHSKPSSARTTPTSTAPPTRPPLTAFRGLIRWSSPSWGWRMYMSLLPRYPLMNMFTCACDL
ncbi:hypothetical protein CPB85DRAFT_548541, partial [Mucidula mucida]